MARELRYSTAVLRFVRSGAGLRMIGQTRPKGETLRTEREVRYCATSDGVNIAGDGVNIAGDLAGATVILTSRIAAKAVGDEILVADTVRELCSGKGFLFAGRGEFVAKGIEESVRVYEVRPRE